MKNTGSDKYKTFGSNKYKKALYLQVAVYSNLQV